ncbi:MAG: hypothetical protein QOD06_486 [Candidatus Binatota bacterium]|jgi:pimeloyl-ACP methyl ester carboxylesterase|nr:hypothetical protein [Candidatus Binatota bacterium]
MPYVELPAGRIWYEEAGRGPAVVCLHSGWGRAVMPFDDARERLASSYRLIFPDRRGYGRSDGVDRLPAHYHADAAEELHSFLDALALDRPILWGHSDGAITAALHAAARPDRVRALVLESVHFRRRKSREFFERHEQDPESLPGAAQARLAADHGDPRWQAVIRMHSRAWLELHDLGGDFYDGALERIRCPVLVVHGARDPHTPIDEIEELLGHLARAEVAILEAGGHSPHSEPVTARAVTDRVATFLATLGETAPSLG